MKLSQRNLLFILSSTCLFALMSPSIRALIEFSSDRREVAASHIILVPFVTATLIFLSRRKIFESIRFSVLPGAATLVAGLALMGAGRIWGNGFSDVDQLSLVTASTIVMWLGTFLFFYGGSAFRQGLFPLLFLVLCIPIPSLVLQGTVAVLQRGSAETAYVLLKMTGTPVYREGFIFAMPNLVIEVAPECSGIRSGLGMFIVSLLAGHLFLKNWWRRVALVVIAVAIAIFKNAIRIDTLSLLTIHVDPGIIDGRLHHEGGVIFFAVGLLMLYPVLMMLVKSEEAVKVS